MGEIDDNDTLFKRLIEPRIEQVRNLVKRYANNYQDVDSYLSHVLEQIYKYIHTYDQSKSLDTWLHIVTKRSCFNLNKKDAARLSHYAGEEPPIEIIDRSAGFDGEFSMLLDNISDEVYDALMQISPLKLSAFFLQMQGYSIKEIVEIERKRGHLEKSANLSVEIVKSRIYCCKNQLQKILIKNGVRKKQKRPGNSGGNGTN